jgi:hypothetical protein
MFATASAESRPNSSVMIYLNDTCATHKNQRLDMKSILPIQERKVAGHTLLTKYESIVLVESGRYITWFTFNAVAVVISVNGDDSR